MSTEQTSRTKFKSKNDVEEDAGQGRFIIYDDSLKFTLMQNNRDWKLIACKFHRHTFSNSFMQNNSNHFQRNALHDMTVIGREHLYTEIVEMKTILVGYGWLVTILIRSLYLKLIYPNINVKCRILYFLYNATSFPTSFVKLI